MNTIRYVGCDSAHSAGFVYDFPEGHDFWLLILTQTPAVFWVQGEMKEYPANCAVLYPPRHKIYYRACSDQFIDDWVRFDTTESYVVETAFPFGLPVSVPDPGYCHQLFQLLAVENFLDCNYREHSIDYLFRLLFNKLLEASSANEHSPHDLVLLNLRKAVYTNPGNPWTVAGMADYVHLSPGYLQTLYKNRFGISCMDDVIQCRIRFAKEKLLYGHLRIADISTLCGYKNVEHFSRQFRQMVGCTPREFRKSAST